MEERLIFSFIRNRYDIGGEKSRNHNFLFWKLPIFICKSENSAFYKHESVSKRALICVLHSLFLFIPDIYK